MGKVNSLLNAIADTGDRSTSTCEIRNKNAESFRVCYMLR